MCDTSDPMSPDPLWSCPLGGLSAVRPALGWSHITLPGALHGPTQCASPHCTLPLPLPLPLQTSTTWCQTVERCMCWTAS